VLLRLSYASFLFWFVFSVAAYGLTREGPLGVFEWGMAFTFVGWLFGYLLQKRLPRLGWFPWIITLLIVGYGWFLTANAWIGDAIDDDRLASWQSWYPDCFILNWASRNASLSIDAMLRNSALLAAMLIAVDMWRERSTARALLLTIILSSFGMVVFFLLQRAFGEPFLLKGVDGHTFLSFATYRYWGNAASYLGLVWPLVLAVAIYAVFKKTYAWSLWLLPAGAIYFANFLNVSKAGNILAVAGLVLFGLLVLPAAMKESRRSKIRIRPSTVAAVLLPLVIICASISFAVPWSRWDYLAKTSATGETHGSRLDFYRSFVKMIPDAGWSGFGPGNFQAYYRRYLPDRPDMKTQPYWNAHQDYIQTLVEWGYVGTLLWTVLFLPSVGALLNTAVRSKVIKVPNDDRYRISLLDYARAFIDTLPGPATPALAGGALVAVTLTALHAFGDFPMQIASIQLHFLTYIALGWSYLVPADRTHGQTAEQPD
jgi:hypothetical protein